MRRIFPKASGLIAALTAVLAAGGASATTLTPLSRTDFATQTAAAGLVVTTENYDEAPFPSNAPGYGSPPAVSTIVPISTLNGVTYSTSVAGAQVGVTNVFAYSTYSNTVGSTSIDPDPNANLDEFGILFNEAITLTFNQPILAFAIDINTAPSDTTDGSYKATTNIGDSSLSIFQALYPGFILTGQAIGFVSPTPFTSVEIAQIVHVALPSTQTFFAYELDTLRYAYAPEPVPLPGALPLFATGALVVGFLSWRRRRVSSAG